MRFDDKFLSRHADLPERVAAATAYVDEIATFPEHWRQRLIPLRCYILTCLEEQNGAQGDVYAVKLKSYREEWAAMLAEAKAAVVDGDQISPAWPSMSADVGRS